MQYILVQIVRLGCELENIEGTCYIQWTDNSLYYLIFYCGQANSEGKIVTVMLIYCGLYIHSLGDRNSISFMQAFSQFHFLKVSSDGQLAINTNRL